jgi:ABC-2 type transport system permease protein
LLLLWTWLVIALTGARFDPEPEFASQLRLGVAGLFFTQMIFLALGILFGAAMKRYRLASSVSVGTLLGAYFLSILTGLNRDLAFLKYLTPFKYFDAAQFIRDARLEVGFVALSLAIVAACLTTAYLVYSRRDLYI